MGEDELARLNDDKNALEQLYVEQPEVRHLVAKQ